MTFIYYLRLLILSAFFIFGNSYAADPNSISGSVTSGSGSSGTSLNAVPITLYVLGPEEPLPIASTFSDSSGHFSLPVVNSNHSEIYYISAAVGHGIDLTALIGPTLPTTQITVNEKSSVSAAYVLAQFSRSGKVKGSSSQLSIASKMVANLVDLESGSTSTVLTASPNGNQSISLRTLQSLSNLLAAIVKNHSLALRFFSLTRNEQGLIPTSTSTAFSNLARDPSDNAKAIYKLSRLGSAYPGALKSSPDAWVLAVKVNNSGDPNHLIGGVGNIAFDKNGYAWVTNNVVQGTPESSNFMLLFKPDGKPSDGSDGYLPSPIQGGGILGQGFGITIDQLGSIWTGNFGWGGVNPSEAAPGSGSISKQSPTGSLLSLPNGYYSGTYRAQSLDTDSKNNLWIASYGNSSVCVFLGGEPSNSQCFAEPAGSNPFGLKVARDDTIWVANTGGGIGKNTVPSSVVKFTLQGNTIMKVFDVPIGKGIKGLSVDSKGNAWVASGGDNKVYALSPAGNVIGSFSGGGMSGPWSTTIDGEDNVWVANFGPMKGNFANGRLTKLAGSKLQGLKPGHPISPRTGYTLKSAGAEVLLANGEPLYGNNKGKCFCPLMRLTAVGIDQAGNIWALNNWKSSFANDLLKNPGGDGIVIFVGLASPPPPRSE
jgi:hypothetical protein